MKRLVFLLSALLIFLCACSSDAPKSASEGFLAAAKNDDRTAAEAYLSLTPDEKEAYFYGLDETGVAAYLYINRLSSAVGAYLAAALEKSELSVVSSEIEGDTALVTVKGKICDLSSFFQDLAPRVREELTLQSLGGKDMTAAEALEIVLVGMIKKDEFTPSEKEFRLSLQKTDGEWKILPGEEVSFLLTLGLYSDPDVVFSAFAK